VIQDSRSRTAHTIWFLSTRDQHFSVCSQLGRKFGRRGEQKRHLATTEISFSLDTPSIGLTHSANIYSSPAPISQRFRGYSGRFSEDQDEWCPSLSQHGGTIHQNFITFLKAAPVFPWLPWILPRIAQWLNHTSSFLIAAQWICLSGNLFAPRKNPCSTE